MRIAVTFRHLEPSDALRDYVETRLQKIRKYLDGPADVNVVLSVEKFRNTADVVVAGDGLRVAAKEEQGDMHSAIDLLSDKIEKQLRKFKEKQRNKKGCESLSGMASATGLPGEESEERYAMIQTEKMDPKPMSVQEAIAQLQVKGTDFLLFSNAETKAVSCLFWRKDGTLGLVEP